MGWVGSWVHKFTWHWFGLGLVWVDEMDPWTTLLWEIWTPSNKEDRQTDGQTHLYDDAEARLAHHDEYGLWTVGVGSSTAVANRLLCLNREQQGRREIIHLHTRRR